MDKKQLNVFRAAFKRANYGKIAMPNKIDISKIYEIEFYPNGMRNGYHVRFLFIKDESQHFVLELLGSDDYSSWHKRIDQHGNITDLENYKGQHGRIIYPDDPERTAKNTRKSRTLMRTYINNSLKKGLNGILKMKILRGPMLSS